MRKCSVCKVKKPYSEFHKDKSRLHGIMYICKVCQNDGLMNYYSKNPDKRKSIKLKQKYGITLEDFKAMVKAQKGRCKICGLKTKLNVDHNHDTGKVRGLLCHKCNTGIGLLNDDLEILEQAVEYLKENDG